MRITLASGAEFEGIYASNPTDPSSCSLRMVQQRKLPNSGDMTNGSGRRDARQYVVSAKGYCRRTRALGSTGKADGKANGMLVPACSNLRLVSNNWYLPGNNRSSFRTDTAISNSRTGAERVLKPWVPDSTDEMDGGLSLQPSGALGPVR